MRYCDVVFCKGYCPLLDFEVRLLRYFLGRLAGICGEGISVVRFAGLYMFVMLVGLGFNNAHGLVTGNGVASVSKHLDSACDVITF